MFIQKDKVNSRFKYSINEKLDQLPRRITIQKIEAILKNDYGISRDTFYRDRNMQVDDPGSIPSERLDIYAALFGVTPDELKNYTVSVKPLSERKLSHFEETVIKKTKLRNKSPHKK